MHRDLEQSRSLWTMKQLSKYLLAVFDVLLLFTEFAQSCTKSSREQELVSSKAM